MTLKEYLLDYASPETREIGEKLIQDQLKNIPRDNIRQKVTEYLAQMEHGERDFRF